MSVLSELVLRVLRVQNEQMELKAKDQCVQVALGVRHVQMEQSVLGVPSAQSVLSVKSVLCEQM